MFKKFSQIGDSLPSFLMGGGLPLLTVAFIPVTTLGFELPKFLVLSMLALGCALLLMKEDVSAPLLGSLPGKVFLAFMLVTVLSPLWSVAPVVSVLGAAPRFQGVLTQCCFFALAIFAAVSLSKKRSAPIIAGIIAANILVVLHGILQMLKLDPLAPFWESEAFLGRIFSTLGHPNTLGQFLLLTAPFLVLRYARSDDRVIRLAWGSLLVLNAAVLLGTVSRSALLGALVLIVIGLPGAARHMGATMRGRGASQAFAFSLVAVLGITIGLLFFAQRFSSSFEAGRSASAREIIWSATLAMVRERPAGWGLETMAFTSPRFVGKEIYAYESLTTTVDRIHNEPLQVLQALGPLGFVPYVAFILLLLLAAVRYREQDRDGLLRASVAAILGYQIAVFFGFPSVATGAFFWLIVGVALGVIPQRAAARSSFFILHSSFFIRFLLIVACTIALISSLMWSYARVLHAAARMEDDPAEALTLHRDGILAFGYDRESLTEVAEAYLHALETSGDDREDLSEPVRRIVDQLRSLSRGYDGMPFILEAWLSAIMGNREEADRALSEAETLLPASITLRRAGMHIAEILRDGMLRERYRAGILQLLPPAYFEPDSALSRILQKQHFWLKAL